MGVQKLSESDPPKLPPVFSKWGSAVGLAGSTGLPLSLTRSVMAMAMAAFSLGG